MTRHHKYIVLMLSDTVGGQAQIAAPGLRYSHNYHPHRQLGIPIMDNRIFDLSVEQDVADFNRECMNACRAAHKYTFPVPRVLYDSEAQMCGLPLISEVEPPVEAPERPPDPAPEPEPDPTPREQLDAPLASLSARKEATKLGIDLTTVKATGIGGLITLEDVRRTWRENTQGPEIAPPGTVSMDQLLAGAGT